MDEFQKLIIQYPPELWYEKRWIISILSVILGALIGGIIQLVSGCIEKMKLKREITRNLFVEIYTNQSNNRKALPKIKQVLSSFKLTIENDYRYGRPSIVSTGIETTKRFFDLYCSYLILFDKYFFVRIYSFYQHYLPCVKAGAKRAESQFIKFYKKDPMISADDIINTLNEYIANIQILIKSADELLVEMINANKGLREVSQDNRNNYEKANQKINKYLDELEVGKIFDIDELVNEIKVHSVTAIIRILQNKSIRRIDLGKYEKIKN
jgi:hypothetical protein